MPNQTTNYGLIKPLDNETADIGVINQNMDTIDSQLNVIEGQAGQNNNELSAHKADEMPHQFTEGGASYRWGMKAVSGVAVLVYEEVV